jgi:hypothetical protein
MTMMIDRKARDILAENFRHLITGQITNDEFEDRLMKSKDAGVKEVFYNGAWPLYDDLQEHKLTGMWAVVEEGKPIAARYILFLKTDLEYEWPRKTGLKEAPRAFLGLFTLGLSTVIRNRIKTKGEKGDKTVWLFYRPSDYEKALERPPYLAGK